MIWDVPGYVHGTALIVGERGILIRGPSGAGKTSLATALIENASRQGWFACLVGDDRVALAAAGGRVVVRTHPAIAGLIERRGCGICAVPFEPAAVLALVVDLAVGDERYARMPVDEDRAAVFLGIVVPRLAVPDPYNSAVPAIIFEQLLQNT